MKYFKYINKGDIQKLIETLITKGYVSENDLSDIYFAQHSEAVDDLNKILKDNGYTSVVNAIGYCHQGIAFYGVYDSTKIEYEEAYLCMKKEWKIQNP